MNALEPLEKLFGGFTDHEKWLIKENDIETLEDAVFGELGESLNLKSLTPQPERQEIYAFCKAWPTANIEDYPSLEKLKPNLQ